MPEDLRDNPVIIGGQPQNETYGEFQHEMDMINRAFLEVMSQGDRDGRIFTFPIPTYNVTKDFNWTSDNAKLLFEVTGKYGLPYFQNFINSDLNPGDVRSMCCRLQMDMRELRNKTGGLFGAGEQTDSIGVVTINMPRIGYLAKDKEGFYRQLDRLMRMAMESLEVKRKSRAEAPRRRPAAVHEDLPAEPRAPFQHDRPGRHERVLSEFPRLLDLRPGGCGVLA